MRTNINTDKGAKLTDTQIQTSATRGLKLKLSCYRSSDDTVSIVNKTSVENEGIALFLD